jgi:hypothetical protein
LLILADESRIFLCVIDGASTREKDTSLQQHVNADGPETSLAQIASRICKTALFQSLAGAPLDSLSGHLLNANQKIKDFVEGVYGEISAEAVLKRDPHLHYLREDPRLVRLVLPVCMCTLAKIDLAEGRLSFAHTGDTALFTKSGEMLKRQTIDSLAKYDSLALDHGKKIQNDMGIKDFSEVSHLDEVREINKQNGLFHNYVDENQNTDLNKGVGVLDGLPELAGYIQEGSIALSDIISVLVCSDGFLRILNAEEELPEVSNVFRHIGEQGIHAYLAHLRARESLDSNRNELPRFKTHDDATGIFVEFE